ncbi:peptidoglycan recognition protein family protein [Neobacillus sp. K501]
MKNFKKTIIAVMLLTGSAFTTTQSAFANDSVQNEVTNQTEIADLSIISVENGKSTITSPAPGKISTRVFSNFKRSGEFILYNSEYISLYTSPNGAVSGGMAPQVVKSTQRNGQWFLINTYLGQRWVYNDEKLVGLRDVVGKNANLTLQETVYIHTEPFPSFRTDETIAPSTVHVVKQAGSWFLVEYNSRQVWITTDKAKFDGTVESFNTSNIHGVPYKKMIVPTGNVSVRPAYPLKPDFITVHNTANTAVGADADLHGRYLLNQAASNPNAWVSWHFTVDDEQIIQHLPLNESAFHAGDGDGPGNRSSIGIEITENADGNYAKAEENAKKLITYLIDELNIPMDNVKGHINWSGKYCPRVILDTGGWSQFMTELKQVYQSVSTAPPLYRVVTGGMLGEETVKRELEALRTQTGWWVSYESTGLTAPYFQIVTGEYTGEEAARQAMNALQSDTGMWMTYEKTRPAYSIYRIVTGGFKGKENVERALGELVRDTGWWATYEATGEPDTYRIVTGGLGGEAAVKEALTRVTAKGWWATYEERGEPVYYYRIRTGEFLDENAVRQALSHFTNRGWWATYEPSGRVERYFRIVTGGFAGLEAAEQKAQWLRDTRGWWVSTQKVN